jgi:hypothetical protein
MNNVSEKPRKAPRRNITVNPRRLSAIAPTPKPAVDEIPPVCVHRWVIESPNGETSRGVCRYCGAEKDFPNAAEDGLWERNVPQSRWTGRSEWKLSDSGF